MEKCQLEALASMSLLFRIAVLSAMVFMSAVILTACTSSSSWNPRAGSGSRVQESTNAPQAGPRAKAGRVGYGFLAVQYDRDADGRFEECRRGTTIYFDRDGEGMCDLVVEDTSPSVLVQWDEDFDGFLDHSIVDDEGYVQRWTDFRQISVPAPRIFKDDRIQKLGVCPMTSPKHEFWVRVLRLSPPPIKRPEPSSSQRR